MNKEILNKLLSELADEIDITESQEGAIKRAYNGVASWLNQKGTIIAKHKVAIFPQGSMMYGTTIRPINETDDYDIDLVCEFTEETEALTPEYIKQRVGKRLLENPQYRCMLKEEGRRCWTLQYNEELNFHMDILPSIPFSEGYQSDNSLRVAYESMTTWKKQAILATDKNKARETYKFIPTNPKGYAQWFIDKANIGRNCMANESIERVPNYPQKTVLQKAIQLLKRYRDVMFGDDKEDVKPISIIITTLIAMCYNGETQIYDFICKALKNLENLISKTSKNEYIIENPVMSSENFADKWRENPDKALAFYRWQKKAIVDFRRLETLTSYTEIYKVFKEMFAQKPVDRLMNRYQDKLLQERVTACTMANDSVLETVAILEKIPHRVSPPWELPKGYSVKIKGEVSNDNKKTFHQFSSGTLLCKGDDLKFTPLHSIKPPYEVKWQITNTGKEAREANCLRGELFEDGDIIFNGIRNSKIEATAYVGTHYVQCFIIKNGNQCVGVSEPFVVRIH